MADITNTDATPAESPSGSQASTAPLDAILLRALARALLAAATDIRAAGDSRLLLDRTRPANLRPASRARQSARSPGRHSGRQLAASPDVTGSGSAKPLPRPAGRSPVVDSDSLGSSS